MLAVSVPIGLAAISPLLAWRDPIYIIAGFAGIFALAALLFQPLLAGRLLPTLTPIRQHKLHRFVGMTLVALVIIHVAGLWITSPPDVIDALLFASPTPFSVWGVIAMWAIFATAVLTRFKRHLGLKTWRLFHKTLAVIIVAGTILHAVLIQGTMEPISKAILCLLVATATLRVVFKAKP